MASTQEEPQETLALSLRDTENILSKRQVRGRGEVCRLPCGCRRRRHRLNRRHRFLPLQRRHFIAASLQFL